MNKIPMRGIKTDVWRHCTWLILAIMLCGCDGGRTKPPISEKGAVDAQDQAEIAALAERHGARQDWHTTLPEFVRVMRPPFSVEVSRALMPSNGQPLLLVMKLDDVTENAGHYTAKFSKFFYEHSFFEFGLEVTCTPEQAQRLLKSEGLVSRYALVATISEVSRVKLKLQERDTPGDAVEMTYSPGMFVGKGVCLDLLKLGNPHMKGS